MLPLSPVLPFDQYYNRTWHSKAQDVQTRVTARIPPVQANQFNLSCTNPTYPPGERAETSLERYGTLTYLRLPLSLRNNIFLFTTCCYN
jgi:hypothetical protein